MGLLRSAVSILAGIGLTAALVDWYDKRQSEKAEKEPSPPLDSDKPATTTTNKKASPVKAPPSYSAAPDGKYPDTGVYVSDPDFCTWTGETRTVNGKKYMCEPLIDKKSGLYARLTTIDAQAKLQSLGFRLLTEEEWYALVALRGSDSLLVEPCTLVHTAEDQNKMRSLGYQKRFDDCVHAGVEKQGGLQGRILICGKYRLLKKNGTPAPAGKQINFGFFQANGRPIQSPGTAHEDTYTDYSELTQGVML